MPKLLFITETPNEPNLDWFISMGGFSKQDYEIITICARQVRDFRAFYKDKKCTKPTDELRELWTSASLRANEIGANVTVPLGQNALKAVTDKDSILKWRGSIIATNWGSKCIPTLHPNDLLKSNMALEIIIRRDFRKVKSENWFPQIVLPKRNFIIGPNMEDVREYFEKIRQIGHTSVDIETQYYKEISCIGFSCEASSAICIPFRDAGGKWWYGSQEDEVRGLIADILGDPQIGIRGQNLHYDWSYLKRAGYGVRGFEFDTMVAQHSAWPELDKSLAFLASFYTKEPYWKDDGKDWKQVKDFPRLWQYNATDVAVTEELVETLKSEIKSQGVEQTFNEEMRLVPIFMDQTLRGIKFNTQLRDSLKKDVTAELKSLQIEFDAYLPSTWGCKKCKGVGEVGKNTIRECPKCAGTGVLAIRPKKIKKVKKGDQVDATAVSVNASTPPEFPIRTCSRCDGTGRIGKSTIKECPVCKGAKKAINLSSPTQVKEVLAQLKFPSMTKRNTGKETSDIESLKKLTAKFPSRKELDILLAYAEKAQELKFLKTKIDPDGRIRTTLACNTETGRLNSKSSPFGTGTNLQNIKRR